MKLSDGVWAWKISLMKYIREVAKDCNGYLADIHYGCYKLPMRAKNPNDRGYDPK